MKKSFNMNKKNIFGIISLLLLSGIFSSCEKVIDIDLKDEDKKVVIQALVTNENGIPARVRVTTTASYFSADSNTPVVNNATVVLRDDAGYSETLASKGNGYYESVKTNFTSNKLYMVDVSFDGKTYNASSFMKDAYSINAFYPILSPFDSPTDDKDSALLIGFMLDPIQQDFFRIPVYVNGKVDGVNSIIVNDDKFYNDNALFPLFGQRFAVGDTVEVILYNTDKASYDYYFGLQSQVNNDGGFFSGPPANLPSNFSNGAIGLFEASSITRARYIFK